MCEEQDVSYIGTKSYTNRKRIVPCECHVNDVAIEHTQRGPNLELQNKLLGLYSVGLSN